MKYKISNSKIVEYANNAYKFFSMFNGNPSINPTNTNIDFYVDIQSPSSDYEVIAIYTFDNVITVYLYSILHKLYRYSDLTVETFDDCFYSVMYESIIHELYHSNQVIDMFKYNNSVMYSQETIEAPVIAKANRFMQVNKEYIESTFNFQYIEDIALINIRFRNNPTVMNKYMIASTDQILINTLSFMTSTTSKEYSYINSIIPNKSEIQIDILSNNCIIQSFAVKANGIYEQQQLIYLYNFLNMYNIQLYRAKMIFESVFDNSIRISIELNTSNLISPIIIKPFDTFYVV